jgi:hypothetical protein
MRREVVHATRRSRLLTTSIGDTLAGSQADVTVDPHPAIQADRLGFWQRDLPLS